MSITIVLSIIALIFLHSTVKFHTRIYIHFQEHSMVWFFTSVIFALIIYDTYFYSTHYIMHHRMLFGCANMFIINPTSFFSHSFHIIEAFFEKVVLIIMVMVLPVHPLAISLFVVISFTINVYGHLGYEIAPLWFKKTFLFKIINTFVYHNLDYRKLNGNYGLYFRFWDRIMKTEHPNYVNTLRLT